MSGEETLSSRRIFQGRVVGLRVDQVRLPSGRLTQREVVEHRGAVALVALDGEGNVLFVRHFRKAIERELLELPAGTLEHGEEPEACARRELREETGYRAGRMEHLVSFYSSPGFLTERLEVFLARELVWDPLPAREEEIIELRKLPLGQALALIAQGHICDAKSIIGILLTWKRLCTEECGGDGGARGEASPPTHP